MYFNYTLPTYVLSPVGLLYTGLQTHKTIYIVMWRRRFVRMQGADNI